MCKTNGNQSGKSEQKPTPKPIIEKSDFEKRSGTNTTIATTGTETGEPKPRK